MKKWIYIGAVIFAILLGGVAFLAYHNKNSKITDNAPVVTDNKKPAPVAYTSQATVTKVSGTDITVTVAIMSTDSDGLAHFDNQERTVKTDAATEFLSVTKTGTQKAKLSDLKSGAKIYVTGTADLTKNQTTVAKSIQISK